MSTRLPLKFRNITDSENRWTTVRDLLSLLAASGTVAVDVPSEVGIGLELPTGQNRPSLFVRTTAVGDFAGLYAFTAGEYRRVDNFPNPGEIRTLVNFVEDVTELAAGWHLADGTNGTEDRSANFTGTGPSWDSVEVQYTGAA